MTASTEKSNYGVRSAEECNVALWTRDKILLIASGTANGFSAKRSHVCLAAAYDWFDVVRPDSVSDKSDFEDTYVEHVGE